MQLLYLELHNRARRFVLKVLVDRLQHTPLPTIDCKAQVIIYFAVLLSDAVSFPIQREEEQYTSLSDVQLADIVSGAIIKTTCGH